LRRKSGEKKKERKSCIQFGGTAHQKSRSAESDAHLFSPAATQNHLRSSRFRSTLSPRAHIAMPINFYSDPLRFGNNQKLIRAATVIRRFQAQSSESLFLWLKVQWRGNYGHQLF
jgi:hypothetical protein